MSIRKLILRADAVFLGFAAFTAFFFADIPGVFLAKGPLASIGAAAPQAGIGFLEAHGLAFILAIVFFRVAPDRFWHLIGAGTHLLLGTCNLIFWEFFVSTDSLAMGYLTTGLHWTFVVLQLLAAAGALGRTDSREALARPA